MQPVAAALPASLPATAPGTAPLRTALALGMVGALGDELLAALLASTEYRDVHVAVQQPIGSATARFRPWVVGGSDIVADDAYVCIAGPDAFVPKASPMQRTGPDAVVAAARIARAATASRLVVVSPLSALLQLNAAAHTLGTADEFELAQMGFGTLIVVRPTVDDVTADSGWIRGLVRSLGRMVLEIMLPHTVQPLRARTAAIAIVEAVRRSTPGVHVLGARELHAIVAETMPHLLPRRSRLR